MSSEPEVLLEVRNLVVDFDTPSGIVRVLDGISLTVRENEVFCIVGESGSGKSVTALAIMGLLPSAARVVSGEILYRGKDLLRASGADMRRIRGKEVAMVFQDPMTAMNPVIRVGNQIDEMIRLHDRRASKGAIKARSIELLNDVRVPNATARYSAYPHQFSGGMLQRAMIAMGMAHTPSLLIADEPTTALDVTIQAQVLDLLREKREEQGAAMILITHDLGVVAESADRVAVMYSGRIAETGTVEQIFYRTRHPYTLGLLASLIDLDAQSGTAYAIPGQPPQPSDRPSGCAFHVRCGLRQDRQECSQVQPEVREVEASHRTACHFAEELPVWVAHEFPALATDPDRERV